MSTATPIATQRLTVDEYHRQIAAGALAEDEPVELIEGWVVPKMPNNPPHASTVQWIADLLRDLQLAGWCVRMQLPITTADSEPEPDVVVARGTTRDYRRRHSGPADIGLVIEVASTSLAFDRGQKARIYARAAIAAYWVVDIEGSTVEVLSDPDPAAAEPHFRGSRTYLAADRVPVVLGGRTVTEVPVNDLFV